MKLTALIPGLFAMVVAMLVSVSVNAAVPYTEDFNSNDAGWRIDTAGTIAPTYNASGGPDGSGFISVDFVPQGFGGTDAIPFRNQSNFATVPSGGNFQGNWVSAGLNHFSAYVKHTASIPLQFFGRFTGPGGPGFVGLGGSISPNVWTKIDLPINEGALIPEGPVVFSTVFSNVGRVQVGFSIPSSLNDVTVPITVSLDQSSISTVVPEPSTCLLLGCSAVVLFWRRRAV